jgi:hypothetical protein
MNQPRNYDQALPEVVDRCCVAVVEVLLHLIDGPLDAAAVRRMVCKVDREDVRAVLGV